MSYYKVFIEVFALFICISLWSDEIPNFRTMCKLMYLCSYHKSDHRLIQINNANTSINTL
jgi:hypothetical protein